jgi:hypothetical protein
MTLTNFPEFRLLTPDTGALSGVGVIDANTEKVGFIGPIWHPTVKTGNIAIRKVHFRCGAITLNAASEVRVSLQNVSTTAGPPLQPDGSQDEFYDFKTATTALSANAWNSTGNLSADRTVALSADSYGDANSRWLAVVMEYQVFTAADSIVLSGFLPTYSQNINCLILNTGSWANSARMGSVAFECDDGTFAFMAGSWPFSAVNTAVSVSSSAAVRRAGVKFKFPVPVKIDRFCMEMAVANGSDGTIVLYDSDGTTSLVSVDLDNDAAWQTTVALHTVHFEPVTLAADTFYRLVFVGGNTTASTVAYNTVNAAGLMGGFRFGQNAHWTEYDGATWNDTTTRRPIFDIGVCAYDDGASTGGGARVIGG